MQIAEEGRGLSIELSSTTIATCQVAQDLTYKPQSQKEEPKQAIGALLNAGLEP